MAAPRKSVDPNQSDIVEELRRRDPPTADAPASMPSVSPEGDDAAPDTRPTEDGGVAQHPTHDSDAEDLGPQDYDELTDEVAKTGIRRD